MSTTVLIATFNRARYLEEALASVLQQTRPVDQVIVVDDGSTDDTRERVAALAPRVEYIAQENAGKAAALNRGLKQSTGEVVWFFDDDDLLLPDAHARLLDMLQRHPDAGLVFSGHQVGVERSDGALERGRVVLPPDLPPDQQFRSALRGFPFLMQGMLVRRKWVDAIGGFDERFLRGQDYEFCLRLLRSVRACVLREVTLIWRTHGGPRGPARDIHDVKRRQQVWMRYAALMGSELRSSLPLGDYLVPRRGASELDSDSRRTALLERASVMAGKGLLPEMLEDLKAASGESSFGRLAAVDQEACSSIGFQEYFLECLLADQARLTAALAALAFGLRGREVVAWIGRSVLWSARHGDRVPAERRRLLLTSLRLLIAARMWPRAA